MINRSVADCPPAGNRNDGGVKFQRWTSRSILLLLALLLGMVGFSAALYRVSAPHLLLPQAGARWIVSPALRHLAAEGPTLQLIQFRTVLTLPALSSPAIAQLRSLGHAEWFINGRSAVQSQPLQGRIETASADLAPYLQSGDNEIMVQTRNTLGPMAIQFSCGCLAPNQALDWQVSLDGRSWRSANAATDRAELTGARPESMMQWNGWSQLVQHAGLLLLLAASGVAVVLVLHRMAPMPSQADLLLGAWQWVLMLGLTLLHAWNFTRLPPLMGMDMTQHIDYVNYVLRWQALPFADQGWQMFQPPFAYLIAALVETVRAYVAPGLAPLAVLRLLTLACSLSTAWLACRICRLAFDRASTAAVAMLLAAFLPMSLYMAPAFSNEPFAALFGVLLVLESVRLLKGAPVSRRACVRIGLWIGLGLLSKPTILLLLPVLLVLLVWRLRGADVATHGGARWRAVGGVLALGLLISGGWYGRNILHFGRPFVGGWESGRGADWWQYPGYRVPEHWLRFGESLVRPLYSGLDSFWDSIYSTLWLDGLLSGQIQLAYAPPWNYSFMVSLGLLSLPVTVAMMWGAVRTMCWPKSVFERGLACFAGANLAIFLAAMAGVYGQVAAYSAGKGSYLLCALACLPLLAGLGVDVLMQRTSGRILVGAWAAVWWGFVMLAFTT